MFVLNIYSDWPGFVCPACHSRTHIHKQTIPSPPPCMKNSPWACQGAYCFAWRAPTTLLFIFHLTASSNSTFKKLKASQLALHNSWVVMQQQQQNFISVKMERGCKEQSAEKVEDGAAASVMFWCVCDTFLLLNVLDCIACVHLCGVFQCFCVSLCIPVLQAWVRSGWHASV